MPNIKMKKGEYRDRNAIYDVMNYCLNHDLRYYNIMYLSFRNDCTNYSTTDREEEIKYIADFWNTFLDVYNKNCGKRFNHFIIGIGYEYEAKVPYYANILPNTLLQLLQDKGFPGLVAYHVTPDGYHHIHMLVGMTNIYGESAYMHNINAWTIAHYLNTYIPGLKMQVVADD